MTIKKAFRTKEVRKALVYLHIQTTHRTHFH